jgi:hypothetical protein
MLQRTALPMFRESPCSLPFPLNASKYLTHRD